MIETLGEFFRALREAGVRVSTGAAIDAVRALEGAGIESRAGARLALRLACAKDRHEQRCFDAVFERFFVAPSRTGGRGKGEPESAGLGAGTGSGGGAGLVRHPAPRREAEPHRPRARRGEKREGPAAAALAEKLREQARDGGTRLRRVVLARPVEAPGSARRRDLARPASAAEERALAEELARMIAELRLREGRRRERGRSGRLAPRRTLRASLGTGGVPFELRFERRRRRRPRLVLLIDVSRSVERAAGLFLRLAASFLEEVARTRVYAFVDRPIECTRPLLAWARGGHAAGRPAVGGFGAALAGLAELDRAAASDYGRVFFALQDEPRLGGRDLVLVVLGDGRNNRFDALPWAFAELARRARVVVWLVPERRERWGTGDSALGDYLPAASVAVECHDLEGLARGLAELRRAAEA